MRRNLKATYFVTIACASLLSISALGNSILEIGTVVPGTPANLAADQIHLTDLIGLYNIHPSDGSTITLPTGPGGADQVYTIHPGSGVPAPILPTPTSGLGPFTAGSGGSTLTITLVGPTIYDYLTVKWGNDMEAYYINGLSSFTVPNDVNQNGWSGFELWDPHTTTIQVPEGGTTVFLLGSALSGLYLIRRKIT